jgi:two-component system, response regulator PdtaR
MDQSGKPTVLIVEDETFIRMEAADILSDAGCISLEAADADEALEVLTEHPEVSLLFTDINMPGTMDGLVLAEHVVRTSPDMALIVTSGKRRIPDADLPDHGVFLPKPYRRSDLVNAVHDQLEARR